jgi:hypothetical protein
VNASGSSGHRLLCSRKSEMSFKPWSHMRRKFDLGFRASFVADKVFVLDMSI